jgi:hypothetical protein
LPLIGAYQAANALTAAGLVIATGGEVAATLANLQRVQPVRGRLERAVISRGGAAVYVDYAHTPDAIESAIEALRPHAKGRLIIVFGAGGDRDTGKRAEMGAVAARLADMVIVTDDNPRSEDPAAIRRDIWPGAPGAREVPGRREAIAAAIAMPGRTTSSSSPARATSRARSSATGAPLRRRPGGAGGGGMRRESIGFRTPLSTPSPRRGARRWSPTLTQPPHPTLSPTGRGREGL